MELGQLRGVIARGDGAVIVQQLSCRPWPVHALQLIGDGLLVAFVQDLDPRGDPVYGGGRRIDRSTGEI